MPSEPLGDQPDLSHRQRREIRLIGILMGVITLFPMVRTSNWLSFETALDASFSEGSQLNQLVYGLSFLLAGILTLIHSRLIWNALRRTNPFLLALIAWTFVTVLWSPEPITTLKRCIQLLGVLMIGLCLTLPWIPRYLLDKVLLRSTTALVLLSAIVALLLPAIGVDTLRDNAWRGITWHKNTLGAAAAFACLLWVTALVSQLTTRRRAMLAIAGMLIILLLARSSTALATGALAIGVYFFMRQRFLSEAHLGSIVALGVSILTVGLLLIFYTVMGRLPTWAEIASPVTTLLNRDADLTGRTEIWQLVLLEALQHPLRGLGYGAFWLNVGSASQYIIDQLGWVPLQAHSAYIDLFNEVGIIGLSLFVAALAWHIHALRIIGRHDPNLAAVHWAVLILILVSNIAETQIFNGVTFYNNLLFFSLVLVAEQYRQQRRTPLYNESASKQ